jgi:hypothetical protein
VKGGKGGLASEGAFMENSWVNDGKGDEFKSSS